MGSGSASKTRLIIEALLQRQSQFAVHAGRHLGLGTRKQFADSVAVVSAAHDRGLRRGLFCRPGGTRKKPRQRTLALFLGSNISNFDLEEALRFLRALRSVLNKGDALLLGADLKKDPAILEAAYNDSLGVTSAFNLNVLARINRELGGTFDLHTFQALTLFTTKRWAASRFTSRVWSTKQCVSRNSISKFDFAAGELIHTENSYKYDLAGIARLAGGNRLRPVRARGSTRGNVSAVICCSPPDVHR